MTLLELAERCEVSAGRDRELDLYVWAEINDVRQEYVDAIMVCVRMALNVECCPLYTASLDAALTLVPSGWRWVMREACPDKANPNEKGFFARLETHDFESVTWGKGSDWLTDKLSGQDVFCWAASAPLAICAASLRARAAIADTHPKDGDVKQAPLVSGGGARSAIAQPSGDFA